MMKSVAQSFLQTAHYKSSGDKIPLNSPIVKIGAVIFLAGIGSSMCLSVIFGAHVIIPALVSATILSIMLVASLFLTRISKSTPEKKPSSSTLLSLPNELIRQILDQLQVKDQLRLAQVNKAANYLVQQATIRRAIEYGYKGNDFASAHQYLATLFRDANELLKDNLIPKEYIVQKGKLPFFRDIDLEATIRKATRAVIVQLSKQRKADLQRHNKESFVYNHRGFPYGSLLIRQEKGIWFKGRFSPY